jgi:hypothetical protein
LRRVAARIWSSVVGMVKAPLYEEEAWACGVSMVLD